MAIPVITVTPSAAAAAYGRVDGGAAAGTGFGPGFGEVLGRAVQGVIDTSRTAEAKSLQAITGGGDITDVVTAVAKAQLALQTTTAIRDRVVQAYQDIMKMPI